MYVHLANARTVGRELIIFGVQEFNCYEVYMSVPGEYEPSTSKNRGPSERPPQNKTEIFSKTTLNNFDAISLIFGYHCHKQNCNRATLKE
jgi:hypothetical protein